MEMSQYPRNNLKLQSVVVAMVHQHQIVHFRLEERSVQVPNNDLGYKVEHSVYCPCGWLHVRCFVRLWLIARCVQRVVLCCTVPSKLQLSVLLEQVVVIELPSAVAESISACDVNLEVE